MAREDDKLPSVVVVLIGLICVYISLTPVFGNHILIYGGCFLVRKIDDRYKRYSDYLANSILTWITLFRCSLC